MCEIGLAIHRSLTVPNGSEKSSSSADALEKPPFNQRNRGQTLGSVPAAYSFLNNTGEFLYPVAIGANYRSSCVWADIV